MEPDNSAQKAASPPPPSPTEPGPASAPPQPAVKAEIVASIPVAQQATENQMASDQPQPAVAPKPEANKVVDLPKPTPKNLQPPKPPKTQTKPRPLLAITTAGLVAAALAVAAFFAFRHN